jgi:hypothetical protein
MSLLDTLTAKINNDSSNYIQFGIPAERVQNVNYDTTPVKAGSGYFRVWAVEMRVTDPNLLVDYYPVLHSVISFDYNRQKVELTRVTGLDSLKSSTGSNFDMNKTVALNFPLTDLIPFNGGNLELSAGLMAMKQRDMLQSVIKMASDFSAMLAVPQLSSALQIAQPLANNIERLIGLGDNVFRLGYHNTFTTAGGGGSNDLRPQYIVVIAAKQGDGLGRDGADHWIVNDHLVYIDPNDPNKRPVDVPRDYMLLRLEVRRSRDDWTNLSSLNDPFVEAMRLMVDDATKSKAQLKRAILQVLESPDVAEEDRMVIAQQLRKKYDERFELVGLETNVEEEPLTLGQALDSLNQAQPDAAEPQPAQPQPEGMQTPGGKKGLSVDDLLNV